MLVTVYTMRRTVTALIALLCSIALGATVMITLSSPGKNSNQKPLSSSAAQVVTSFLEGCQEQPDWEGCVLSRINEYVETVGVASVANAVYEYGRDNELQQRTNCHQVMHTVGRAAVALAPDMVTALAPGQLGCQLGFQHGVIEQTIDNTSSPAEAMSVCDPLLADQSLPPLIEGECYHAIGHGIVKHAKEVYTDALDTCQNMGASAPIETGCVSGVLMSWSQEFDSYALGGKEIPARLALAPVDKSWEICLKLVTKNAREGCANFVAEKVPMNPKAYASFGTWCVDELGITENCMIGVGRTVGGRDLALGTDPSKNTGTTKYMSAADVVTNCNAASKAARVEATLCIAAAVGSRANFVTDDAFIKQTCAAAPTIRCESLQTAWDNSRKPRSQNDSNPTSPGYPGQGSPSLGTPAKGSNQ